MKFVFKLLQKDYEKRKVYINGKYGYSLPVIFNINGKKKTLNVIIDESKTFTNNGNLYFKLDTLHVNKENPIEKNLDLKVSDEQLLKALRNDYLAYLTNQSGYEPQMNHAVNFYIPLGIDTYLEDKDEYMTDKWSETVNKIFKEYPDELVAIDPYLTSKVYPFKYKKFQSKDFIMEYRSNIIMYVLSTSSKIVYDSKPTFDGYTYIYYQFDDGKLPIFRMLTNKQFYESCFTKDVLGHVKKPFLKSFGEHGISKEIIEFYKEDEVYKDLVNKAFFNFRSIMDFKKNKKLYFIKSLDKEIIPLQIKAKKGQHLTKKELELLNKALEKRYQECVDLFDQHKMFYFSSDEIEKEDLYNYLLVSKFQEFNNELSYDKENGYIYNTIYGADDDKYNDYDEYPLFEVIDKHTLDILKDIVFLRWKEDKLNQEETKKHTR